MRKGAREDAADLLLLLEPRVHQLVGLRAKTACSQQQQEEEEEEEEARVR